MAMDLARRSDVLPSRSDWQTMREMSEALHQSGLLPTWIKNPLAALAVIQKGAELGMTPMYALSRISMIEGKPSCDAEGMAALVYRDHGANAFNFIETTSEQCVIEYCRRGGKPGRLTFTMEDARRAGLAGKQNWKNYPQAMLRARAISAAARMAFPDTIGGLKTPDELGAEVDIDEHGEMTIKDLPVPPASPKAPTKPTSINRGPAKIKPTEQEQARADQMTGKSKRKATREELIASLEKGVARARALGMDYPDPEDGSMDDEAIRISIRALAATIETEEKKRAAEEEGRLVAELEDDEEF